MISHIRAVLDAEAAYAVDNGGRFGDLECLIAPDGCGRPKARPYLERPIRSGEERYGYQWRFMPRRPMEPTPVGDIEGFAIVAEPSRRANRHGFAADQSGRICATDVPSVVLTDGTIRRECRTLH